MDLIFFLFAPRAVVRFGFGAAFFRAARFRALRSAVSVIALVFAIVGRDSFLLLFLVCRAPGQSPGDALPSAEAPLSS
jgi:hypothetical protein